MVLAVDIGNSNIVIGCFDDDRVLFVERLSTNHQYTDLEYVIAVKNILELNSMNVGAISGCIISSVVPSVTETVKSALARLTHTRVMTVGPGIKTGLRILLDNPVQLGSDRVADAVAAVNLYEAPLIIIDMGTATTVSVIDAEKNYLGGMIIPGLRVSLDSLTMRTSQLPKIGIEPPKRVIGANTVECMKSGIIYYSAAGIDGVIERVEESLGSRCTVVSTGGLAAKIITHCKRDIIIDDQLLLKGLMIIYKKNQK